MKIQGITAADVTFLVKITVGASYGPDWRLQDMHDQILRESRDAVRLKLNHPGWAVLEVVPVSISTTTKVQP